MPPKGSRKRRVVWVVAVLGLLSLLYWGLCWVLAEGYVSPIRLAEDPRPDWLGEVDISSDGGDIPAWTSLAEGKSDRPVFLLAHGYGGNRAYWSPLAEELRAHGDVLIPAMAGQGASRKKQVGFGLTESRELVECAEWIRAKAPDRKIALIGVSMGGAAAWLASKDRPELFDAVITEGSFMSLEAGSRDFLSVSITGGATIFRPIILMAERKSGITADQVVPVRAAEAWKGKPALIIHGGEDRMFRVEHAQALAKASGAEIWEVPAARHAEVTKLEPKEYARRAAELLKSAR